MVKRILSIAFLASIMILLTNCVNPGDAVYENTKSSHSYSDKNAKRLAIYDVQFLFEHDGTRIYRFYDNGRYKYFAVSRLGSTMVDFYDIESNGGKVKHKVESSCQTSYVDN